LTPTQQRKVKQNIDQQIEGLPNFNPKFRIIVNPIGETNTLQVKTT